MINKKKCKRKIKLNIKFIFALLIVLFLIIIIINYISNKKINIGNKELLNNNQITEEIINNSIQCKIDSIILDDNNKTIIKVISKNDNKIYELKFIDNFDNSSKSFNEGDELFCNGYIENNVLYVKEIYKNTSLEERQMVE